MKVFIGSSNESLPELRRVACWIEEAGLQPLPWEDSDIFPPGSVTLHRLIELTREVVAAVFVFGPDDKVWYRGSPTQQPRDNVLIEFGLFASALGPSRAIICHKNTTHKASDLDGINHVDISSNTTMKAHKRILDWASEIKQQEQDHLLPTSATVWPTREEVTPSILQRAAMANEDVFFVGLSFETVLKDYRERLAAILNNPERNVRVRLLMADPDSLHVKAHGTFSDRPIKDRLDEAIHCRLLPFFQSLSEEAKAKLQVRTTHYLPRFAARIYDRHTMLINFYLYASKAHANPVIELSRRKHSTAFNQLHNSLCRLFQYGHDEATRGRPNPNRNIINNGQWVATQAGSLG